MRSLLADAADLVRPNSAIVPAPGGVVAASFSESDEEGNASALAEKPAARASRAMRSADSRLRRGANFTSSFANCDMVA